MEFANYWYAGVSNEGDKKSLKFPSTQTYTYLQRQIPVRASGVDQPSSTVSFWIKPTRSVRSDFQYILEGTFGTGNRSPIYFSATANGWVEGFIEY